MADDLVLNPGQGPALQASPWVGSSWGQPYNL